MRAASHGAAGLGVVSLLLQDINFHTNSGVRDRGFVLLRHVQHALLLEPRASVPLPQDLELGPVCGELLRESAASVVAPSLR
jgi:hypothetical protein